MLKAIIADGHRFKNRDFEYEKQLFESNGFEFEVRNCNNELEIIEQCADANVLMVVYTLIGKNAMDALKKCKAMVRYGIGFDIFDVDAATKNNIMICNIPDYCISEVATHAASMILASARQLLFHTMRLRDGQWRASAPYPKHRLTNQTLGFVGFGNIARQTASYLKAFDFNMVAYDPFLPDHLFEDSGVKREDLEELCKTCDIISVHTPLNKETYHLIDENRFEQMKDGVILVNTSRGAVICENALINALKKGKVGSAGLDVFENEPLQTSDHPFFNMDNVLLSPHVSFDSLESSNALMQRVAETAVQILNGEIPAHIVNRKGLGL